MWSRLKKTSSHAKLKFEEVEFIVEYILAVLAIIA